MPDSLGNPTLTDKVTESGGWLLLLIRVTSLLAAFFTTYSGLKSTLPDGFWSWFIAVLVSGVITTFAYWCWGQVPKMSTGKAIVLIVVASLFILPGSVYWTVIHLGSRAVFFDELKHQVEPLEKNVDLAAQQMANEQGIESHLASAATRFAEMAQREERQGAITQVPGKAAVAIALNDIATSVARAHDALAARRASNEDKLARLKLTAVSLKKVAYGGRMSRLDKDEMTFGAAASPSAASLAAFLKRDQELVMEMTKYPSYEYDHREVLGKIEALQEPRDVSLTDGYQLIQQANTLSSEIAQGCERGTLQALLVTLEPVLSQAISGDQRIAQAQLTALESVREHLEATRLATQAAIDGYPAEKPTPVHVPPAPILVLTNAAAIPGQWLTSLAVDYAGLLGVLFFVWARKNERKD